MKITSENVGELLDDPTVLGIVYHSPRSYGRTNLVNELIKRTLDKGEPIFIQSKNDHLAYFKTKYQEAIGDADVEPVWVNRPIEPLYDPDSIEPVVIGIRGGDRVFTGFKITKK